MSDLISRADAIEAVAQQWLFEASVGNPYVNDDDIGEYRKLAEELFEDVPSADAVQGANLINRHDAITVIREECWKCNNMINDDLFMRIMSLPTSQQTDCTELIEWLTEVVMDDEDWELNAVAYGEIICRKLVKLGILEATEEPSYYIRPSADAVQGEWEKTKLKDDMWICSACGSPLMTDDISEIHFCPNCGARMKGGAE